MVINVGDISKQVGSDVDGAVLAPSQHVETFSIHTALSDLVTCGIGHRRCLGPGRRPPDVHDSDYGTTRTCPWTLIEAIMATPPIA
jgi:hypothetical protein